MRKSLLGTTAAICLAFAATPALASTTIDFETTAGGSATVAGNSVGSDYTSLGLTFTDALYFQCGGGCPTPSNGHFISGTNTTSGFSVVVNGTTDLFSFENVSFSSGTAQAFDLFGTLLETINFSAYPGTNSFSATGIHSITFAPSQSGFGVDNFVFGAVNGGVPEPATWAMMLIGFAGIGYAMRRQPRAVAKAA